MFIPPELKSRMTPAAQKLESAWGLPDLFQAGSAKVIANVSRFVVDLVTRDDQVVPFHCPSDQPIYLDGQAPDQSEIERRREHFYQPFHDQALAEVNRSLQRFGRVAFAWVTTDPDIEPRWVVQLNSRHRTLPSMSSLSSLHPTRIQWVREPLQPVMENPEWGPDRVLNANIIINPSSYQARWRANDHSVALEEDFRSNWLPIFGALQGWTDEKCFPN